jgi:hypothetical protein
MAYLKIVEPSYGAGGTPCKFLLSKGMFLTGKIVPEPGVHPGDGNCWCGLTQHAQGPDDGMATRATCTSARDCYQARL